jgi:protein-S-isoprenylcysteine O-methyltransferase Ste14
VPAYLSFVGDILIVLSFLCIFWVLKVNGFAAANISVANDHKVIDTGPYAYVRHPMYAGALWLFIGIPLALGSWLTICLAPLILPLLIWRLLDEERILRRDLSGLQRIRKPCAPSPHTAHLVEIGDQPELVRTTGTLHYQTAGMTP